MYLDRFVGQTIDVAVKPNDKWTKLFKSYFDPYDYMICELIAVDEIGIWVKESADIVIVCDKAGDSIPKEKAIKETTTVGLLIKWQEIETIRVYKDSMLFEGKKQFCTLNNDESIDDCY